VGRGCAQEFVIEDMTEHRKLIVWQKAMFLTEGVYRVTTALPSTERFGLVTQMRRCSVSIPSNIAEGCGRSSRRDRARFLDVAYGSVLELETQLEVSRRLGYVSDDVFMNLIRQTSEVGRMLNGLKRSLRLTTDY
jgi:four helix bundle protein